MVELVEVVEVGSSIGGGRLQFVVWMVVVGCSSGVCRNGDCRSS